MIPRSVASKAALFRSRTTTVVLSTLCTALVLAAAQPAAAAADAEAERDPWEEMNRRTYNFNEWLDKWVLVPVATGWDVVAPEPVQTGISNIFRNSETVVVFVNNVLQLKPARAAEDFGRWVTNTTVGIGGLFDVATSVGIPENDEDFGQTLGYWGVPPGPYLVLPIFGPSNPRDTFGFGVDTVTEPWAWFVPIYVSVPVSVFEYMNLRTIYLEEIDEFHETALDYYVFQRNAYVQNRALAVRDIEEVEKEEAEALYYFDDEEE